MYLVKNWKSFFILVMMSSFLTGCGLEPTEQPKVVFLSQIVEF